MIQCLPMSICPRDFIAHGLASGAATVEYNSFTEQGRILCAGVLYEVRKHGLLSGHWTLERNGTVVADARKDSAMFRRFEVSGESLHLTLRAESSMSRAFEISCGKHPLGSIRPAHPFTRRANILCADTVPEHLRLFCFWLVGLLWRRAENNAASS